MIDHLYMFGQHNHMCVLQCCRHTGYYGFDTYYKQPTEMTALYWAYIHTEIMTMKLSEKQLPLEEIIPPDKYFSKLVMYLIILPTCCLASLMSTHSLARPIFCQFTQYGLYPQDHWLESNHQQGQWTSTFPNCLKICYIIYKSGCTSALESNFFHD